MTDTTETVKNAVYNYIKANPGTSYAELERIFKKHNFEYKGDLTLLSDKSDHVIFWSGWNAAATNIIATLIDEKRISREPCQTLIYLIDGAALTLPILKGNWRKLKKDHWLPCVFVAR